MMNVTKRLSAMLAAMIMVFCTPLFVFAAGQTELRDDVVKEKPKIRIGFVPRLDIMIIWIVKQSV